MPQLVHYSHTGTHRARALRLESPDSQDRMRFPRTTGSSVPKAKSKHMAAHSALIHWMPRLPCSPGKDLGQGPRFNSSSFCTQMRRSPDWASEGIAERRRRSSRKGKTAISSDAPESCLLLALWLSEPYSEAKRGG